MSEDKPEKEFLTSLDRRIMEHDTKLSAIQRDYTEVGHEIKEVLNRINGGLSPSVNDVKKENGEIKRKLGTVFIRGDTIIFISPA